jgi:hypothetical protein
VQPRPIGFVFCASLILLSLSGCGQHDPDAQGIASPGELLTDTNAGIDRSSVLKLRGVLKDHEGKQLTGVVGVLFAIYTQKDGGSPVWLEVQNVDANDHGRFVALVGTTKSDGIAPELFNTEETLWLGMQVLVPFEGEQPRIRLVKTADGLIARRTTRLVIPENPANQRETVEEQASGQATTSSDDQSGTANPSPRIRRRLAKRSMP